MKSVEIVYKNGSKFEVTFLRNEQEPYQETEDLIVVTCIDGLKYTFEKKDVEEINFK